MKKFVILALAMLLALSFAACGNGGNAASGSDVSAPATEAPSTDSDVTVTDEPAPAVTTVEAGKLHMSTNASFPPYEMTTDDGGFEGIDVEIASAVAAKLGLELVVDDMGFDAALISAQNGQSDMVMAGVSVTEARLEVMDFSETYAIGVQVIIVKDGSPIETVDDLADAAMIGTQKATTGYIYCSGDYGEDHVTAYENGATAVMALLNDQVDCVVIDNMPAQEFVANNPGLKILDTAYAEEEYAIGFAKGNTQLVDAVNAALAELRAEGTIDAIIEKYIHN
ncbi:MAG: amino acid ABC transporter substrate-binding protein [Oscillospiraceae bacterium]|nr:amino acid ABC transporter substrate-binding protein [Oscillospiraceae bacterium]